MKETPLKACDAYIISISSKPTDRLLEAVLNWILTAARAGKTDTVYVVDSDSVESVTSQLEALGYEVTIEHQPNWLPLFKIAINIVWGV